MIMMIARSGGGEGRGREKGLRGVKYPYIPVLSICSILCTC